jgi:hypothetical protein
MARNNEDRMGARDAGESPPPSVVNEPAGNNVGLNFVVPTEHVELPSRGMFYPEDHPLHGQETIEIKHMTAKEEEILTSRTLLKKGIAIDRLLQNVILDKRINVNNLLVGDKNAVLVYTRMLAYGSEYSAKVTCPSCGEISEHQFDLQAGTTTHPGDFEDDAAEGFSNVTDSTFGILLPKTQVLAEVRLLFGEDESYLTRVLENRKKRKLIGHLTDSLLTAQMKRAIVSLNGVTDRSQIDQFIMNMPAADSRHFRRVYAALTPNYDLKQEFSCSACGDSSDMEVPLTAEFFWPK